MGVTGSGKSTFISLLADQPVEVGHSLHSSTVDIRIYSFDDEREGTIVLIDTPGFDDTTRSNTEVLKEIAFFLAALYKQNLCFCGIIYLHRITDPRMQGSTMKNLRMLQLMCGKENFKHVALATTMWENMKSSEKGERIGHQRLMEMRRPDFFGQILGEGRDIIQHDGSPESARKIVRLLTEQNKKVVLDIQYELIDEGMSLDETSAGQYLREDFLEAQKRFDAEIAELQGIMEDAMNEKDEETMQAIRAERKAAETRIMRHAQDWEGLNITMQQLTHEKHLQYRDLAMNFREREQARSTKMQAAERRIRELEIMLNEMERERKTESTRISRESPPRKLNRSREQTRDRQRERLELHRDLSQPTIERRIRPRGKRRESPILMLLKGMFGGLFGYPEDEGSPWVIRRQTS
ncbi:conserved hypothetical protein [Talaromyces stipitatus ATCC 10500]|uniref:G domain-containing protein n=1 Tax=Talaromyces stipitatus (strain ATCC 10500 / CBS 375.48 / QM 6759 / NRRL 1006) TaxID=441959 RepID=B8M509_TALSN|nr:uncharacterized protein TSTA_028960 [Talaromyces stipitatus ATCC 10500]EED19615.1 conserved hypothetical protein [Talaromyces stipitatus ATCC 10500]